MSTVQDRPLRHGEGPPITPEIDDTVRQLLGDSYPENVFLIYLPQRVTHAFLMEDSDDRPESGVFHWVAAFWEEQTAFLYGGHIARQARPGGWWYEPMEVHSHPLDEACQLVQRVYPTFRGLVLVHADGRRIRHYVK